MHTTNCYWPTEKDRYEDLPVEIDTASGLGVFVVCGEVIIAFTSSLWVFSVYDSFAIHATFKLQVIWMWLKLWQFAHPTKRNLGKGKMATDPSDIEKEISALFVQSE